ncbi:MAG: hypothetical protein AABY18_09010 [Candidatus Thermoplasmatota archaeon]
MGKLSARSAAMAKRDVYYLFGCAVVVLAFAAFAGLYAGPSALIWFLFGTAGFLTLAAQVARVEYRLAAVLEALGRAP